MPRKPIKFSLDFMKKDIFSRFTVKQFDDVTLTITPLINNEPYNVSNMACKIYVGVNNEMYKQDTNITVSSNSIVVTLDKNMLSKDGRAYAEIELTDSNGTVTSSSFIFDIDRKIGEGASIPGAIDGFVAKYEKLTEEFKNRFNELTASQQQDAEVIDARKGEVSLRKKIDKIDEQFNTIIQLDENFNDDIKYKKLANDIISENIIDTSKILLEGDSKIKSNNPDNFLRKISNNKSSNYAKINSYNSNFNVDTFTDALNSKNNLKVCVWGDSISTSNGDMLDISQITTDGYENSPNGLTFTDTYFSNLIDMFTTMYPNKMFDFYNRAIGGEVLSSWNVEKNFNSLSKSWIEHIKDTNCDLLIIGFGMNYTSVTTSKRFSWEIKQVIEYIKNNFTKIPTIAFLTPPRPAYVSTLWGSNEQQTAREIVADSIRVYAKNQGYYIIDINRISNFKRIGSDFINPNFYKLDVSCIKDISGGINGNGSTVIDKYCKNFILDFYIELPDDNTITILYNKVKTYDNRLTIKNNEISLYSKFADYSNWGLMFKKYTGDLNSKRVTIKKRNEYIDVYVDKKRVIRDICEIGYPFGTVELIATKTTGGLNNISNINFYADEYQYYQQGITEEEMFGKFIDGDYNTKQVYGGNGVNHPTTIGLREVYLPCLQDFIYDINLLSQNSYIKYLTSLFDKQENITGMSPVNGTTNCYFKMFTKNVVHIPYVDGYILKNYSYSERSKLANKEYLFAEFDSNNNILIVNNSSTVTECNVITKNKI